MDYSGTTAVVTGGGHGIGRALAEGLAARGSRVVVGDIDEKRAAKVAARIGGIAVSCDVGDPDSISALVSTAVQAYGPVDIAVSNAGITDQGPDLDSTATQGRRAACPPALDQPLGGQVSPIPDLLRQNQLWSPAGLQRQHVLGDRLATGKREVAALAAEDGPGSPPPWAAGRPGPPVVGLAVGVAGKPPPSVVEILKSSGLRKRLLFSSVTSEKEEKLLASAGVSLL